MTSVSNSPQVEQRSASPPRLPPPSVFFSLYNSTTSSFRAKCSNVVDPFKLYKSSQIEKVKVEKRKLRANDGNKFAKNSSNFNENTYGRTAGSSPDIRTDKSGREKNNLEAREEPVRGGERDRSAQSSQPIMASSENHFNSDNKNTVNRVGHREMKTQQELEYEAERQREIESCFNWVKRASELLQHLPPSSTNSVTGDRRGHGQGHGQGQGHGLGTDMNLNLSAENIKKITIATESIKKQTAVKNGKNLYIDCNDSSYENLNRSSDTNCYDRTNWNYNNDSSDKNYDLNGNYNKNGAGSKVDSNLSNNVEDIYDNNDSQNNKPIGVVENMDPMMGNRDKDPTKSSQLEMIVTYFKSHLSQRSNRTNEMKASDCHSSPMNFTTQHTASETPLPHSLPQFTHSLPQSSLAYIKSENKNNNKNIENGNDLAERKKTILFKETIIENTFHSVIEMPIQATDRVDSNKGSFHERRYEKKIEV